MPNLPRQAPGTTIISYPSTATPTSSSADQSTSTAVSIGSGSSTPSSSLYLFTFLITIVVLGLISGALLFRAYYMRRQFHLRVEEAIRNGRPIPTEAAAALGLRGFGGGTPGFGGRRGKKEKKVGPMPSLWEVQMYRDGEKWELQDGEVGESTGAWDDLTPLSISHFIEMTPAAPSAPAPPPTLAPPTPSTYLRSLLSTRPITPQRPTLARQATAQTIPEAGPKYTIPSEGDEVVVGVMIAMPVEGAAEERWNLLDGEEERDVPEVCLGVMSSRIGS